MARPTPPPVPPTEREIQDFVENQASFGLEMQVVRILRGGNFSTEHGGRYTDPHELKPRQFDIRAIHTGASPWHFTLNFAIECKAFSELAPMVVFEVERRKEEDRVHAIKWSGRDGFTTIKEINGTSLYGSGVGCWVGKSTDNFRRQPSGPRALESEVFAKWSQAIHSAHAMACSFRPVSSGTEWSFYFPVLVVPDGTLYAARFRDDGECLGIESVVKSMLYLNEETPIPRPVIGGDNLSLRLSHLHIYTLSGIKNFAAEFMSGDDPWSHLSGRIYV